MPYKNKADQRAAYRRWYKRHGRTNTAYTKSYRQRNKGFVNIYKIKHGCVRCGYNTCAEALDFHHTNEKEKEVSKMARNATSIDTLKAEINKCVVLCSNCHRELHAGVWTLS